MRRINARFDRWPRPARGLWIALIALVIVAVATAIWAWSAKARFDAKTAQRAQSTQQRQEAEMARSTVPVSPPPYDSSAREMLAERTAPWPAALTAIEHVAMVGVTPTSIEFAANERTVNLEVAFSEHAKLLEYADALNAGLEPSTVGWRWSIQQTQLATGAIGAGVGGTARLTAAWR